MKNFFKEVFGDLFEKEYWINHLSVAWFVFKVYVGYFILKYGAFYLFGASVKMTFTEMLLILSLFEIYELKSRIKNSDNE